MVAANKYTLLIIIFICARFFSLRAEVPPLERELNLSIVNEKIGNALQIIQQEAKIVFSYQPSLINPSQTVSVQLRKRTVREALALILPGNIIYKARNNYIILKEKPSEKPGNKKDISGYVIDAKTQQKVANVTIYDPKTLQSATSDAYGFYTIKSPPANATLSVNRQNYKDTTLNPVDLNEEKLSNIPIVAEGDSGKTFKDSIDLRSVVEELGSATSALFKQLKGYINTLNVRDTLHRNWQVSFLPFVGTNHKLSGNVYNDYSFNVLGGYSRGTNVAEIGGLFNIDKNNVSGFQAAGLFNLVGDSLQGAQVAGLFNVNGVKAKGAQGAGLMNINRHFAGSQFAGLMNINEEMEGFSGAGLMNINEVSRGATVAGLANVADTLDGVAVAGLFNSSRYGRNGVQVAGLFNAAGEAEAAVQVAGLFNVCGLMKGFQVAPLNISDSATGVPLGLLSIVRKGVHQLELSADEVFYTNLSFRTGVPVFYNILSMGLQPGSNATLWQLGYGLGTSFRISNRLRGDITASIHHVSKGALYLAPSELHRLCAGIEYRLGKKVTLAAGPTVNLYFSDMLPGEYNHTYKHIAPYTIFDNAVGEGYNLKGWVGAKVSIRFF